MKLIDEHSQVNEVAARWKKQYYQREHGWSTTITGDTEIVYEKLRQLPKNAAARDVAAIIGNGSWAGPSDCNECGETVARTVEVGQPPGYESHTTQLCEPCVRKALSLFQQR